jgi:site-specific DNA-adenine methylase
LKILLDEKKIRKGRPIGLPYIGSKKKISKKLIEIIKQNFGTDKTIYDLFGGGGAITLECMLQGLDVVYNDIDPIPGLMIQKILSEDREYLKTLICSREEFLNIRDKENKSVDDHLKLLINSFGNNCRDYLYSKKHSDIKYKLAKEIIEKHDCFYGYKQTETFNNFVKEKLKSLDLENKEEKNQVLVNLQQLQQLEQLQRLQQLERLQQLKQLENIQDIEANGKIKFYNKDYKAFSNIINSIIYLDPPYKNTSRACKYNSLNYDEFYSWCKDMSEHNIVLISGYDMPDNFEVVYEFRKARSTMQSGYHESKYEKLYMIK